MKSRSLILLFAALLICGSGVAATKSPGKAARVQALEFEVGASIITPSEKLNFDKKSVGWNLAAELRYNCPTRPFDFGLRIDGDGFYRKLTLNKESFKFRSYNALFLVDLNINRQGIITPFIGVGLGAGIYDNEQHIAASDITKERLKGATFCCMPRVGVEVIHRIRVTLYYKYFLTANSHFGLSLGFAMGGRRK